MQPTVSKLTIRFTSNRDWCILINFMHSHRSAFSKQVYLPSPTCMHCNLHTLQLAWPRKCPNILSIRSMSPVTFSVQNNTMHTFMAVTPTQSSILETENVNGKIQDSFSSHESSWFDNSLRDKVLPSEDDEILGKSQKWDPRDLFYAIFMTFVHVLCLFAPSTFSWSAFRVGFIGYILTGIFGITISYHRNLSHRSFKLPKYLEYLFAYFAMHAYQGDPIFWVSTHRYHHKVADTKRDPHSPVFEGMFHAHLTWIYDFNKVVRKGANYNNVRDLTKQPYYRFLQKTMVYHVYGLGIILYLLGGFPYIVWGLAVRTVWGYHATFIINSIGHSWGPQAWDTKDSSRNVWWMCLFTFGDSWHNNHHAFAFSARHGLEWWQIDLTWYLIKSLAFLGLATDIKLPTEAHKKKKAFKTDSKDVKMGKDV